VLRSHANAWDATTDRIIGAAIEVHRELGPGLLESAYQACLAEEMSLRGMEFRRHVPLQVQYRGRTLESAYQVDFVVQRVVVELKAVESLAPVHFVQVQSYLRASAYDLGLLINFNVPVLKEGVKRIVRKGADQEWIELL
jgi:GxxExxY protein